MHRQTLLSLLEAYTPADTNEQAMWQETLHFVQNQPDCFQRTLLIGHITGSAWLVSPDRQQAVLIHHRKLDRWFQAGGHCDGDPNVAAVARREAEEETGLLRLHLLNSAVFDVDVHPIPERGAEPAHYHYDIRFLFEADPAEPFTHTAETKDIRWVPLEAINALTDSESILRMVRKTKSNNLMGQ
ncbi:NUDIX hydrolase [Tellurirhabdus bombi]|uniref:NUDIX hydrolase n=1 Tax=Tellurirhabdus bombi TaxID=2907205 RepID=UPI001F1C1365|nr:NUDIX hydrolase [Tellurirhabdus bombi]